MLVFIDESGDSGFKFECGSSEFFTVTAVIFTDGFSADACDRSIACIHQKLELRPDYEFHFTECSDRVREAFFFGVRDENFVYHSFVLNKRKLSAPAFRDAKRFYEFAVGIVCENARSLLDNAKITIDKSGNRSFRLYLEKSLKQRMTDADGSRRIRKVGMEPSHSNNLVQLADMVCGAVARSLTNPTRKGSRFREIIRKREKRVSLWPGDEKAR